MDLFSQDLRFAWRQLRRTPGFTYAALFALAIGIGATTAVFTVLNGVVLRPLPYAEPDRLAMVWEVNRAKGLAHERISPVNFVDYRSLSSVVEDAAAWWYPELTLTEAGREPLRVRAIETTPNLFAVLGARPFVGSFFPGEPAYSRDGVVVISHRLWRERFANDPSIVGRRITLNGGDYAIAGVMAPGFQYPHDTDVWQRMQWDVSQHSRGAHFMEAVLRLKPGASFDAANRELAALTARLAAEHPSTNADYTARVVPLANEVVGFYRPALFALFGAAGCLLLIAVTNVASLLLARASVREREIAVRAAIGASRDRLVRLLLTESLLLAAVGAVVGVSGAWVAVRLFIATAAAIPRADGVSIDVRVLLFAIGLAVATAVAFGVVPAMVAARGDVQKGLTRGGRGSDGAAGRARLRSGLVVVEVALSIVLLVGTTLLARSLQRLLDEDPGFLPAHAVAVQVDLPYSYSDWTRVVGFYDQLLSAVRADPRVAVAGASNFLPLDAAWRGPFFVVGRPSPRAGDEPQAQHQTVDDGYFRALGALLRTGRIFDARDTAETPGVVIVNEAFVRREFPGAEPIGATLRVPMQVVGPLGRSLVRDRMYQIVGVVANVKNSTLTREAEPAMYFTFRQFPFRSLHVMVRGASAPAELVAAVRQAVQRLDPNLAVSSGTTLDAIVGGATERPRMLMQVMAAFAALALLLAAIGIYSVLSYVVSQRRGELSVRMALGAQPRDVLWLVVRHGVALAACGAVAGSVGALAVGRALSGFLYGVTPTDPAAFGVGIAVALVTSVSACAAPARRAAGLDPLESLRGN